MRAAAPAALLYSASGLTADGCHRGDVAPAVETSSSDVEAARRAACCSAAGGPAGMAIRDRVRSAIIMRGERLRLVVVGGVRRRVVPPPASVVTVRADGEAAKARGGRRRGVSASI